MSFNWEDFLISDELANAIAKRRKAYIGSDTELRDIQAAYVNKKGDMNYLHEVIPFIDCDNEPRIIDIVRKMVDDGKVEKYSRFFHESARKKERRHRKWELEKEEVEDMMKKAEFAQTEALNDRLYGYNGDEKKATAGSKTKKCRVKRLTKKTNK